MKKIVILSAVSAFSASLNAAVPGANVSISAGVASMPVYQEFRGADFLGSGGTITVNRFDQFAFNSNLIFSPTVTAGYNFNRFFGGEVFYTHFEKRGLRSFAGIDIAPTNGSPEFTASFKNYAVGVNGNAYLPINNFDIVGKLGVSQIRSKVSVTDPQGFVFTNPGAYRDRFYTWGLDYGVGLQYSVTDKVYLGASVMRIAQFTDTRVQNLNFTLTSVTIGYNFDGVRYYGDK